MGRIIQNCYIILREKVIEFFPNFIEIPAKDLVLLIKALWSVLTSPLIYPFIIQKLLACLIELVYSFIDLVHDRAKALFERFRRHPLLQLLQRLVDIVKIDQICRLSFFSVHTFISILLDLLLYIFD